MIRRFPGKLRGVRILWAERTDLVRDFNPAAKREAKRAADLEEAKAAQRCARPSLDRRTTFGEYVRSWYARQDLAASTMQNYKRHIENHLLPAFEDVALLALSAEEVDLWEKKERAAGYAASSIKTWRSTLHLILSDAQTEGRMPSNPATKRRAAVGAARGRAATADRRRCSPTHSAFCSSRSGLRCCPAAMTSSWPW